MIYDIDIERETIHAKPLVNGVWQDKPKTRELRDMDREVIELTVQFAGGSASVFGRVRIIPSDSQEFISIGPSGAHTHLPIDAIVNVEYHTHSDTYEDINYVYRA